MTGAGLSNLVVEVLHNRGDDIHPDWSVGSGYFITAKLVLTALHNVDGPGELLVRVHGTEEYSAVVRLQSDQDIVDLAVLEVSDVAVDAPPLRYGAVDRSAPAVVERCWAVGFPRFKERVHDPKPLRLSAQVDGEIPTGENLDQPLLTLRVRNSPRPLPSGSVHESEWAGMSGATVFSGNNVIVGVITEHHLPEGESALTVVPITALNLLPEVEATKWWKLLGVNHQALVRLPGEASSSLSHVERQNRIRLMKRVRATWIEGVLEQSLHQAALIALDLQEQPDALANPWHLEVQETNLPPHPLPAGTSIIQVYDEAEGELLILGEPGAGKTTLLLQLAQTLLERAERGEYECLPVVFNLSSWAKKRLPLMDWLVEELYMKYQVPRKAGQAWIVIDQVLPLLDGLDEVAEDARSGCVQAINTYYQQRMEHGSAQLVICCCSQEYMALRTHVTLHQAVSIQPLTDKQIGYCLQSAGGQLEGLRQALQDDAELYELARHPLMLSILTLAYQGAGPQELPTGGTSGAQQRQVFATYVERMLSHRRVSKHASREQMLRWLRFLARQMLQHNQTEFYLEQLDQSWVADKHLGIGIAVVIGIFNWLISTLFIGPAFALVNGLLSGLFFGLIAKDPSEVMTLSWKQVKRRDTALDLLAGLMFGGAVFVVIGIAFGLTPGLIFGMVSSGVVWLSFESMDAASGTQLDARSRLTPNQGTWRSAQNGLIFGLLIGPGFASFCALIFGSLLGLVFTLLHWSFNQLVSGLFSRLVYDPPFQLPSELFLGILLVLLLFLLIVPLAFGIDTFLEHFILRFLLWRKGHLPWNMVAFLDEATERLLLRKVGGGYIFIHRLLLNYFASLEEKEPQ